MHTKSSTLAPLIKKVAHSTSISPLMAETTDPQPLALVAFDHSLVEVTAVETALVRGTCSPRAISRHENISHLMLERGL